MEIKLDTDTEKHKANGLLRSPFMFQISVRLVAVVFRLIGAVHGHAEVFGLGLGQLG